MFEEHGAEDRLTPAPRQSATVASYEDDFTFALAASQSAWVLVIVKP